MDESQNGGVGGEGSSSDAVSPLAASLGGDGTVPDAVLAAAGTGLVVFGPDATVERIDDRVEEYFGLADASPVGCDRRRFVEEYLVPRLDRAEQFRAFAMDDPGGDPDGVDCRVCAGQTHGDRWLRCYSHPITSGPLAGGRIDQFVDITAEKAHDWGYETVLENFPNGAVALVDRDLRYRLARGDLFEGLAETPADVEGEKVGEVGSGNRARFVESYRAALDGTRSTIEITVRGRELVHRTLPVYSDDGTVRAAIGMTQDITERMEREQALEESRNRYRTLVQNFPNGAVALVDEDLRYTMVGGSPLRSADATASELMGTPLREALPPELESLLLPEYRAALRGEHRSFEASVADGYYRFCIVPVRDDDGDPFAAMGVSQDISDRKERERKLTETQERLDMALAETDTGIWSLRADDMSVVPLGTVTDLFGVESETADIERYLERIHPEDRERVEADIRAAVETGADLDVEFRLRTSTPERWMHARGSVLGEGSDRRIVGITTDVTERVRRERALEKRERILRELHTATREFYPPESMDAVSEFVVDFLENALDLSYASVTLFDEEDGVLRPAARSPSYAEATDGFGPIEPGENPIWDAYRTGESHTVDGSELERLARRVELPIDQLLAVPIGDFGVTVAFLTETSNDIDADLVELVTANAEAALSGIRSDRACETLSAELSTQRTRIRELREIVDTVQNVQERVSESETPSALDAGVCDELATLSRVDFAWVGRPETVETDLTVTASAGSADAEGYLDSVTAARQDASLPAQVAAATKDVYDIPAISQHVLDASWAKEALSAQFNSVLSVPLVHGDVLYAVLTVYSREREGFTDVYRTLLRDVGSLLLNYSRMLDHHQFESQRWYPTLEFQFADGSYPFQQVAARTDCEIRIEAVTEISDDTATVIISTDEGCLERIREYASTATAIDAASAFGDTTHDQLLVTVRKPFLVTDVEKHGGRVMTATSTPTGTRIRLQLRNVNSKRPLIDLLTSRYDDIELVRQEETTPAANTSPVSPLDPLTERQYEVLNAAYRSGYYETPRKVTGEDLAESFDISSPAVYKHLQAAHSKLLASLLDDSPRI